MQLIIVVGEHARLHDTVYEYFKWNRKRYLVYYTVA